MDREGIIIAKGIKSPHNWFKISNQIDRANCPFQTKKISWKHKDILDAYLADNKTKDIQWFTNNCVGNIDSDWVLCFDFINSYSSNRKYRVNPKQNITISHPSFKKDYTFEIDEDLEKQCQFAKYGFQIPKFKAEILKQIDDEFIGYIIYKDDIIPCSWGKSGYLISDIMREDLQHLSDDYSLTKIKQWYEDEDNFPCVMINKENNKPFVASEYISGGVIVRDFVFNNGGTISVDHVRLATKEEIIALLVKQ